MKIGNIECDNNERIVYTIADESREKMKKAFESEGRDFTREEYLVYFTYFVFVSRAAIGGLTKKILDTMGNLAGQKVGNGDILDTFIGKRVYVDYMRKFTDMTGDMLTVDKIGSIVMSIEKDLRSPEGSQTAAAAIRITSDIFNSIQDWFK